MPRRRRVSTEWRVILWLLSLAIPVGATLSWLLIDSRLPLVAQASIGCALVMWPVVVAVKVCNVLLNQVRTLSILLESTRTQDYSMRGARARDSGELAELYRQMNGLAESLAISRQSEQELLSVLEKVVSEINVAIVVFDPVDRIRLANQQASILLKAPTDALIGKHCADTVLASLPIAADTRIVDFRFPGAEGRWQIKQNSYRHQGKVSRIMFIADLKQALSDQEIMAWQRLTRVISHEVNNSLTPIISLCQTLTGMLAKAGNERAVTEGLVVIGERAKGLQKFISAYARLARLPAPNRVIFPAGDLASRLQRIFAGRLLEIAPFPDVAVFGDVVQLEQALINLIKNGLEANPDGLVQLRCRLQGGQCEFQILDRGSGIGNLENLFVPFYTTKSEGAGIGLVLCRQIAAGHHGHVSLENRPDGAGAVATLVVPLPPNE